MAFNTLFTASYAQFLKENRDRPGDLWFFVHIPKTAGTSFRAELANLLTPEANLHVYDQLENAPHATKLQNSIDKFLIAHDNEPHRFASGHIPIRYIDRMAKGRTTYKTFTILRDPVHRFVSDYRYQRTSQHPGFESFRNQFPRIEDYLGDVGQRNRMMQYLAPTSGATVTDTVRHLLDHFAFVGLLEMYPLSFRVIMDLLGARREPSMHLRKTSDSEAGELVITPALLTAIRDANQQDIELYDAVHRRLKTARSAVFAGAS